MLNHKEFSLKQTATLFNAAIKLQYDVHTQKKQQHFLYESYNHFNASIKINYYCCCCSFSIINEPFIHSNVHSLI